ncbi:MAG: hypothetical protein HC831_13985 [Chloroflexia bacterium]|nr:hypothetical protein [Chloroflexia bacterium]
MENSVHLDYQLLKIDVHPGDFEFSYAEYQSLQELVDKTCKLSDEAKAQTSGLHIIKNEVFLEDTTEKQRYEINEQLNQLFEDLARLEKALEFAFTEVDEIYDYSKIFTNLKNQNKKGFLTTNFAPNLSKKRRMSGSLFINLNSTWQYIDFLKERQGYYDEFSSYPFMQKYVIGLKEKVKKCIDDYDYFWQFQKWVRYFDHLPAHVQKLIAAIERQESEKRMFAFKSWYLNQKLGMLYHEEGLEEVEDDLSQLIEIQAELKQLQYNKSSTTGKTDNSNRLKNTKKKRGISSVCTISGKTKNLVEKMRFERLLLLISNFSLTFSLLF